MAHSAVRQTNEEYEGNRNTIRAPLRWRHPHTNQWTQIQFVMD